MDLCFVTLNTIYKTVRDSLYHVQIILNHSDFIRTKFLLVQQSSHTPIWFLKWHNMMLNTSGGKSIQCLGDWLNIVWCCYCTLVWNMIFILHWAAKCQFVTHCNIILWAGAVWYWNWWWNLHYVSIRQFLCRTNSTHATCISSDNHSIFDWCASCKQNSNNCSWPSELPVKLKLVTIMAI